MSGPPLKNACLWVLLVKVAREVKWIEATIICVAIRYFLQWPRAISSFRKGHSTSTVLLGIRDDLLSARKRREVTLMVLADFSKEFDTVCFKTVITKLHHLGFSKNVLEWLANYLCGRRQYVQIDDRKSSPVFSEFGIPQGSILGPMHVVQSLRRGSSRYSSTYS